MDLKELNELNERFEKLLESPDVREFMQYLDLRNRTEMERVTIRAIIKYKLFDEPRPAK